MKFDHLPGDRGRHHGNVAGERVGNRRARAPIGHLEEIGKSGERFEQFAGEMIERADASMPVGELATVRLVVIDEFSERSGRN
jgi:hypothetical protein